MRAHCPLAEPHCAKRSHHHRPRQRPPKEINPTADTIFNYKLQSLAFTSVTQCLACIYPFLRLVSCFVHKRCHDKRSSWFLIPIDWQWLIADDIRVEISVVPKHPSFTSPFWHASQYIMSISLLLRLLLSSFMYSNNIFVTKEPAHTVMSDA